MTLKHFIIHGIAKAQGTNAATLNARPDELPLDDKAVRFAETAFRLFHRQSKGLLFAGFGSGGAKEIFQGYLSQYRTQKTVDFLQFSKLSAQHLADTMQPVNLASGGYLIVAEAEIDGEDQLCLLLLSQEHHFAVDEKKLTLLDVPALNLERMGVGCFISITGWLAQETEPVAYVRGNREVSEYFMRFVGAQPAKSTKDASRDIATYSENFLNARQIDGAEKSERLKRLYDYCAKQYRANQSVDLGVIGAIIYQEDKDEFCQQANEKGISSEFHVDLRHLKRLVDIEYKSDGISLKLSRRAIRENVKVNLAKRELTLRHVDEDTLKEINETLGHG